MHLYNHDTFVSVAGGLAIREPATDLAVALAVTGSMRNLALPADWIFFGEIGLGGELRSVSHTPLRLKEAARLGFKHALLPAGGGKLEDAGIQLHRAADIRQALDTAFGQSNAQG
jgi:DNA repair protein RadA/Sms